MCLHAVGVWDRLNAGDARWVGEAGSAYVDRRRGNPLLLLLYSVLLFFVLRQETEVGCGSFLFTLLLLCTTQLSRA